jgi:alkylated DNA repair dioxygenase AlkB
MLGGDAEQRIALLKHKVGKQLKARVELTHGSLLIMRSGTQENWLHQVSKTKHVVGERLNPTFRVVIVPFR